MTGGAGVDRFIFGSRPFPPPDIPPGAEIEDFVSGVDELRFDAGGQFGFSQLGSYGEMSGFGDR